MLRSGSERSPPTATPAATVATRETLLVLARSMWSMPPDHGAAIMRNILDDATLTTIWRIELDGMCARINNLRAGLAAAHPALGFIARQQGLFALLPIDRATVVTLREQHGIYMPDSGTCRIPDGSTSPACAARRSRDSLRLSPLFCRTEGMSGGR